MTTPPPLLRVIVHGTPGTAGSKSAFPIYQGTGPNRQFVRSIVTEKPSPTKTNWRRAVVAAAHDAIACRCPDPGCTALQPGYPLNEALEVALVFTVAKPASAPKRAKSWPQSRPDLLKYTRATEDALTDAGVLKDDARIVRYRDLAKVYPNEDPNSLPAPGAVLLLWRARDLIDLAVPAVAGDPQPSLWETP